MYKDKFLLFRFHSWHTRHFRWPSACLHHKVGRNTYRCCTKIIAAEFLIARDDTTTMSFLVNQQPRCDACMIFANVLSSIELIEMIHHPKTRKPAFKWLGVKEKPSNLHQPPSANGTKRLFGTDLTNICHKRNKMDAENNVPLKNEISENESNIIDIHLNLKPSSGIFQFGPFAAPVTVAKVGPSYQKKTKQLSKTALATTKERGCRGTPKLSCRRKSPGTMSPYFPEPNYPAEKRALRDNLTELGLLSFVYVNLMQEVSRFILCSGFLMLIKLNTHCLTIDIDIHRISALTSIELDIRVTQTRTPYHSDNQ
ncbi:E2F transcription factor-like E2FF-like protein [Drosera capensis]